MAPSKQRTYGKKGGSAAARALLRDNFVDENTIEEELASLSLESAAANQASIVKTKELDKKKARSRAEFLGRVKAHQRAIVDEVAAETVKYVAPLLAEGDSSEDLAPFEAWGNRLATMFEVRKVAEGSFGEVYKLLPRQEVGGALKASTLDDYGGCIMKVIPLNAQSGRGSRKYSAISVVLREVKLLKKMDEIAGFARFRAVHVLQGKYPMSFTEAFLDFKDAGKDCQNPDPTTYSNTQLFAVVEMDDAGADLEVLDNPSVFQVHDIFWSTVIILANAEEAVEFEHRDLHVGNICIKPWSPGGSLDITHDLNSAMFVAPKPLLGLSGIRTTIIDYTLTRATLSKDDAEVAYDPMKDTALFLGEGCNSEQHHQFECYRRMRTCVDMAEQCALEAESKPKKTSVDKWSRFVPQTNVVWLSYILRVLLDRADSEILPGSKAVSTKVQRNTYATLEEVMSSLNVTNPTLLPNSARHLLVIAEENDWLTEEDIKAFKDKLEEET